MYKMSENGQKRIIFILGEGEILNDDLTQSLPSAINCQVFEVSHVLICSKSRFLQLMQQDFGLTMSVLEQYSARGRRSYRQLKNAPSNIAIGKKVAAKLYKLAFDYGELQDGKTVIKLNLSVTYLADMLSSQRETVSRAIKLLCDESLISYTDKQIVVHDMKKLSDYFKGKTTSS